MKHQIHRRALRAGFALSSAALLLALTAACSPSGAAASTVEAAVPNWAQTPTPQNSIGGVYVGDYLTQPVALQDFTMPSSLGGDLSLSDLNGKWRVMFFGYTHCPDFCPLTLAEFRQVKQRLGDRAEDVTFVFVSVDGARDTGEALAAYLARFDPEFVGFSGDDATLAQIQPDYGFYYRRRVDTNSQTAYLVDHSTRSYLVDPNGNLVASFTYDMQPADIAGAINWWLDHGSTQDAA